jgi:beta-lactamase regulating signal transducer with metallopeptidase domain
MSLPQPDVPMAFASILAKTTLAISIGWCGALWLRRAPAAVRHLVWLIALGGVLLIPAVARVAPVRVAVLPGQDVTAAAIPAAAGTRVDLSRAPGSRTAEAHDGGSRALSVGSAFLSLSYATLAGGLWLLIAGALIGWLIIGKLSVGRVVRAARVLDSPEWATALHEAAVRLDLATAPRLLASNEVEMAFVCDVLAPTIVLPSNADEWSADRRRAVLLHELAHVRRRDLVGHTIARVACAVYWFHPLVWMAARRLRAESELACDDLVLTCGVAANAYARELLEIVTSLGRGPGAPSAALPMARRKEFEGRLLAILDRNRERVAVGRGRVGTIACVLGLLTVSIGAVVPVPRTGTAATVERSRPGPDVSTAPQGRRGAGSSAEDRSRMSEVIFQRLFNGIALTPQQVRSARAVIAKTLADQRMALARPAPRFGAIITLQDRRDSTLSALMSNDADRATFQRRAAEVSPRQTLMPADPALAAVTGSWNGSKPNLEQSVRTQLADAVFKHLFDGIALSTSQEEEVRGTIFRTQQEQRAVANRVGGLERVFDRRAIMFDSAGVVRNATHHGAQSTDQAPSALDQAFDEIMVLRDQRDSALSALLASAADRAKFTGRAAKDLPWWPGMP